MNIIFGPVNSRRFGSSLGIDLSPTHKQCNFDCLYCELAPAPAVVSQQHSIAVHEIIAALTQALEEHPNIDVITVTANGEPTLYPYLDALIDAIDALKGTTQTLILTNSAALTDAHTFKTLLKFDRVKLSLDAVTPEVFLKIDRPHSHIDILHVTDAVREFSQQYRGKLYIEILFVHTLNDTQEEIARLNNTLLHIDCERIDLGTIDRPPAYPVSGISYRELHEIAQQFDATLPIHIASRRHAEACHTSYDNDAIMNTLDKRPLTHDDIALLFDDASKKRLQHLIDDKKVSEIERGDLHFLVPTHNIIRKRQKS